MSKSFAQAPKPPPLTAEAISAFERSGAGQDTRTHISPKVGMGEPASVEAEATPIALPTNVVKHKSANVDLPETTKVAEPTRRLSIDLPQSWHRRFKTACSRTDKKMIDEVTDFIKRRTVELEQE